MAANQACASEMTNTLKKNQSTKVMANVPRGETPLLVSHVDALCLPIVGTLGNCIPEVHACVMMKLPPIPLGQDYLKKTFIINELLCYLQNKMDSLPFNAIVKLATESY